MSIPMHDQKEVGAKFEAWDNNGTLFAIGELSTVADNEIYVKVVFPNYSESYTTMRLDAFLIMSDLHEFEWRE